MRKPDAITRERAAPSTTMQLPTFFEHLVTYPLFRFGNADITTIAVLKLVLWLAAVFVAERLLRRWVLSRLLAHTPLPPSSQFGVARIAGYGFIVLGIYLGLQFAGIDVGSFTIIAGAFGVGLGFGLQNIVSNFVSGIIVAAVVLLFGVFGFDLGGMWTMFTTVGALVAVGFIAVWSVLSNWLCTFVILLTRPFSIGDEVEFAGEPVKGRVVDINFVYTTLHAEDGASVQVPNNLFFQKVLRRRRGVGQVALAEQLRSREPAPG